MKLKVIEGKNYVEFEIGHGHNNALRNHGLSRSLILTESDFYQALLATLPLWPSVEIPEAFRPLAERMKNVNLECEEKHQTFTPTISNLLYDEDSVITQYADGVLILIPLDTFVIDTLVFLASHPVVKLSGFTYDFRIEFKKRWATTIKKLENPETTTVDITPFRALETH